jgi:hypothetical protein
MPYGFVGSSVSIRNSFPLWAKSNVTVWKWSIGRGVKRGIGDSTPHSERPHNARAVATCGTRRMTGFGSPASWAFAIALAEAEPDARTDGALSSVRAP